MNLKDLFYLLRINQWYKNLLIFIPLVFSLNLLNKKDLYLTLIGLFSLCLISSSYYIINDIIDRKKDIFHPEKKNRPIASKKISKITALLISLSLSLISIAIGYYLSFYYFLFLIFLYVNSLYYTFFIRNIAILDILIISINFVIRATSGAFIINVPVSYWVILSTFFISIFMVSLKRIAENHDDLSHNYRRTLNNCPKIVFEYLAIFSIVSAFVFFSIYSIINETPALLLTLPFSIYIVFSFLNDLYICPENIRNPEKFIFKKKNFFILIILTILLIIIFYISKFRLIK